MPNPIRATLAHLYARIEDLKAEKAALEKTILILEGQITQGERMLVNTLNEVA